MFIGNEFNYMMQRNEAINIIRDLVKLVDFKEDTIIEQEMLRKRIANLKDHMDQLDDITANRSSKTRYKDKSYYERYETLGKI